MSKGLEAYYHLSHSFACGLCQYWKDKSCHNYKGECIWLDIETELKEKEKQDEILRIIKEKKVDVGMLSFHDFNYYDYNFLVAEDKRQLTQEEIDLLKEVLK